MTPKRSAAQPPPEVRVIEPELLLQELRSERSMMLVDVRTAAEYAGGHIEGARSVPIERLNGFCDDLAAHHYEQVVVVSEGGTSSRVAAMELALAHFTEVRALDGGMARWVELGYPLARAAH